MAVVAQPPLKSNLDFWGPSSDSAIYPPQSQESMTDIMSYQYPPPPPHSGAEMEMPPSGYVPNSYQIPPPPPGMEMRPSPDAHQQSSQQNVGQDQSALSLAADKKRNKLGYHRTSVACGHCRRRKIRCIPSPADVQGRCVNCIRLKKDCSFYPVDQQPPMQDARQKSAARSSVGPKIGSASSSPALATGLPSDVHPQQPYPQLAMPSIQNMAPPMKPAPGTESFSPDAKGTSTTRAFEYGHPGMPNWMSADASPSSSKAGDMNPNWRSYPNESPITPAFSPYTPHAPAPSATWPAPVSGEPTSREDIPWSSYPAPPTARSMSYGGESMNSQHPHHQQQHQQYPPIAQLASHSSRPYDRKSGSIPSADMYPPPIATTIPGIETVSGTPGDHQHVSLSAGAVPPANYGTWQQPYSYSKPGDNYGGWYGEQGSQHPPEEHPQPAHNMYYAER